MGKTNLAFGVALVTLMSSAGIVSAAPFKIFMISSTAQDHLAMSAAARVELPKMGMTNDFTVDATTDNTLISEANLARYDVFLQMHLAPFEIKAEQRAALENFVKSGKGWVGVHAAGLIIPGEYAARGAPENWEFYSNLIGGVTYVTHPQLQMGTVIMEDRTHPATRNMPAMFQIRDEWYEFSANPRGKVRVLSKADESTYRPVKPQGDHPMMWAQELYPRALYICTGHDASDWQNSSFTTLIRDSLLWAAGRLAPPLPDAGADATSPGSDSGDAAGDAVTGGSGGATVDAAGGSGGTGGSGGASGSGGAGGSAPGTGGASAATGGSSGSGGPAPTSEGCGCRLSRATIDGPIATEDRLPSLLMLGGLGLLAARRRRARQPHRGAP